jgi:flagellar hook-length control protein FliK
MTVETGSAQNTSRPAQGSDANHARGKSNGTGAHGSGGKSGFMAILASLDTPELAVPTTAVAADASLQAYAATALALDAAEADAKGLKPAHKPGLGTDVDAKGVLDSAAALDDAIGKLLQDPPVEVATTPPPVPTDVAVAALPVATEAPLDASALLAQSLQWSAAPAPKAEPANPDLVARVAPGVGSAVKLPSSLEKMPRALPPEELDGQSAPESMGKAGKLQRDAASRQAFVNAALAVPTETAGQPDPRAAAALAAKVADQPLTPMATALAMASTAVPTRRDESTRERSVFRSTVPEGGAAAPTYALAPSAMQAPGAPDPVAPVDMYVAEKVAYWISNDVQNAEMKLDGIGAEPVEVSIRMQGNEAHIAFRTDEILARSALESASVHLKDLLQREGLVLSGVSVGTSGAGDSGDPERRSRQGMRQSVVTAVQPSSADRMSGLSRVTGGALDLFV